MPSSHSPELLVARYLKSNNYTNTLSAFLLEAGLPPDCVESAAVKPGDNWTIESILEEKRRFDASLGFEKVGDWEEGEGRRKGGWNVHAPTRPTVLTPPSHMANVLCVTVVEYPMTGAQGKKTDALLVSLANRELLAVVLDRDGGHRCEWKATSSSPILSIVSSGIGAHGYMTSEMSGKVVTWNDHRVDGYPQTVDTRQDHVKYAVKVVTFEHDDLLYAASAGWDQKVHVYCSQVGGMRSPIANDPSATLTFQTNPECLMFVVNPDTGVLNLVVSRRDSTHLMYYTVVSKRSPESLEVDCIYAGRQNLAPHANAWISFTPFHFVAHPSDPTLIAVATNHTPHMKLLVVRLLFPSVTSPNNMAAPLPSVTTMNLSSHHAAQQAREDLALQNREDAAILLHTTTHAPQTPYSTPQLAWRPDGSGVWVNGDDGVVRGIETYSGKVVSVLGGIGNKEIGDGGEEEESGHEPGSKVRSLWAGRMRIGEKGEEEEVVVSGGFDKRIIVWRAR